MNGDISKASLPITVVAAILMAGLGYWVNAQDAKIEKNVADIEDVEDDFVEQKLKVQTDIGEIRTQQTINALLLKQIAEDIKKVAEDG
jgi:hypothetical protein